MHEGGARPPENDGDHATNTFIGVGFIEAHQSARAARPKLHVLRTPRIPAVMAGNNLVAHFQRVYRKGNHRSVVKPPLWMYRDAFNVIPD